MQKSITGLQVVRLAAASTVSTRTVERVYGGGGSAYSRERVRRAAKKLGLPVPPTPTNSSSEPHEAA